MQKLRSNGFSARAAFGGGRAAGRTGPTPPFPHGKARAKAELPLEERFRGVAAFGHDEEDGLGMCVVHVPKSTIVRAILSIGTKWHNYVEEGVQPAASSVSAKA